MDDQKVLNQLTTKFDFILETFPSIFFIPCSLQHSIKSDCMVLCPTRPLTTRKLNKFKFKQLKKRKKGFLRGGPNVAKGGDNIFLAQTVPPTPTQMLSYTPGFRSFKADQPGIQTAGKSFLYEKTHWLNCFSKSSKTRPTLIRRHLNRQELLKEIFDLN